MTQVPDPEAPAGRVVVAVRAAAINPGEAAIRSGALAERWPSTFPSGEGSDFAGVVTAVGSGVERFAVGDEVLGWTDERASHAELVSAPAEQVVPKPPAVPWEVAGSLYVAGCAAWSSAFAVAPLAGQTVVVSGAAGGVGTIVVQLLRERDVRVIGVASVENHPFLERIGAEGVAYGDNLEGDLRELVPGGPDAWVDVFGGGYVDLAIRLGVRPEKINTIFDFAAAEKYPGVQLRGTTQSASAATLTALAERIADGRLQIPIAATYSLEDVQAAFTELEKRHTHGKIVLLP